jgi:diaminopimelate epimerase/ribosomal protein S18 acetylase RimI-like enzyme
MEYTIIRPGGNDTCLVFASVTDVLLRKRINDVIMRAYPNVEQVGFVSGTPQVPVLTMAGGEFCGNATRSAAAILVNMQAGKSVSLLVSGVDKPLTAGFNALGHAYARMPVYADTSRIIQVSGQDNTYIVEMEGITHYIILNSEDTSLIGDEDIKQQSYEILRRNQLTKFAAAGVMYVYRDESAWRIDPVVYVRDIDTLFRETACGSGTTALGLVLALRSEKSIINARVIQRSGMPILVSVSYDGNTFQDAVISGPVSIVRKGTVIMNDRFGYICERIMKPGDVDTLLTTGGLSSLYRNIFSKAPYFESFTDNEIRGYFLEYATQGLFYVARVENRAIGFGAALPLWRQPEVSEILKERGVNLASGWYMADLGVDNDYRRNGIARTLVMLRMSKMNKGSTVVMRTSVNNKESQALYGDLGFTPIEGAYQNVRQMRTDGSTVEDMRLFLAKQIV